MADAASSVDVLAVAWSWCDIVAGWAAAILTWPLRRCFSGQLALRIVLVLGKLGALTIDIVTGIILVVQGGYFKTQEQTRYGDIMSADDDKFVSHKQIEYSELQQNLGPSVQTFVGLFALLFSCAPCIVFLALGMTYIKHYDGHYNLQTMYICSLLSVSSRAFFLGSSPSRWTGPARHCYSVCFLPLLVILLQAGLASSEFAVLYLHNAINTGLSDLARALLWISLTSAVLSVLVDALAWAVISYKSRGKVVQKASCGDGSCTDCCTCLCASADLAVCTPLAAVIIFAVALCLVVVLVIIAANSLVFGSIANDNLGGCPFSNALGVKQLCAGTYCAPCAVINGTTICNDSPPWGGSLQFEDFNFDPATCNITSLDQLGVGSGYKDRRFPGCQCSFGDLQKTRSYASTSSVSMFFLALGSAVSILLFYIGSCRNDDVRTRLATWPPREKRRNDSWARAPSIVR